MVTTPREHECVFPIEHRADQSEVLFACRICKTSPAHAIKVLQQTIAALEDQIHQMKKKT